MKNKLIIYSLLLVFLGLSSCKEEEKYHTVNDKIEALQIPYDGTLSSEKYKDGTSYVEVSEGDHHFLIPERKSQIKSYSCTECHSVPLSKMKGSEGKKAHWDISIKHANSQTMDCASCHNSANLDELNTLTGSKVDFNLSYKLCAQCHSTEFTDWKGGSHGKKVQGWAPPRGSLSCVNCHNPHDPSFGKRWPVQFNTQKAIERKEGLDY